MTNDPDGWIQLYNSGAYDFTAPSLDGIRLETIAHSLANQCRFNGHCIRFYSVAEHSVLVSGRVAELGGSAEEIKAGLMHDAAEAIICDLPRPLRKMDVCKPINDYIAEAERLIRERWPADYDSPLVQKADLEVLATEKIQVMHPSPRSWGHLPKPLDHVLACYSPSSAEREFQIMTKWIGLD